MIEKAVVTLIVLAAVLYAFRALAPAAWLSARVAGLSQGLTARGWTTAARWAAAYAPSKGGCGGCDSCDTSAPPAGGASGQGSAPVEKPLVFHRPPRR